MTRTAPLYVYTNGGPSGRVFVGKFTKAFQVAYYTSRQWIADIRHDGPGRIRLYEISATPLPYACDIHHPKFDR